MFRPMLNPKVGFTEIEYDGRRVYKRASDDRLFYPDMTPVIPYTAKEARELAYETLKLIEFDGQLLSVDEAGVQFWHYYPDTSQSETAEELRSKISEAKDRIREMYPDPEVEEET